MAQSPGIIPHFIQSAVSSALGQIPTDDAHQHSYRLAGRKQRNAPYCSFGKLLRERWRSTARNENQNRNALSSRIANFFRATNARPPHATKYNAVSRFDKRHLV